MGGANGRNLRAPPHNRHRRLWLHRQRLRPPRGARAPRRPRDRAGQAHLRRQPGEHRGAALRPRRARRGRRLRRRAGRPPRGGRRRRGALRRRVPQRQLHRRPLALPGDQRPGHLRAHRGVPQARRALPPRLHRRGLRRPCARRPGPLHRGGAVQAFRPVQLHQGGLRHARARLGEDVRPARDHLQLLQQLRALPARGEVRPAPDNQPDR